eukprot:s4976_g1.t1
MSVVKPLLPSAVQRAFGLEEEDVETPDPVALQDFARQGGDVFSSLCKAVAACLEHGSQPMLLRKVEASPAVQANWLALQRARAVGLAMPLLQVLLERPHIFEVLPETEPRLVVEEQPEAAQRDLRPDLLAAVQASIARAGGKERLLALQAKFRLTQAQCQQHFDLLSSASGDHCAQDG